VQAKFWCTTSRAKKVSASLTVVAVITQTISSVCRHTADVVVVNVISDTALRVIVPLAVLVINMVVAVQARRAASNAASVNLGVQRSHHQTSTSNNSAVPTVMLVATSLVYVLIYCNEGILVILFRWKYATNLDSEIQTVVRKSSCVASALITLVFAYNFYVYLITGKQFRSELRKLFCRCLPTSSTVAATL